MYTCGLKWPCNRVFCCEQTFEKRRAVANGRGLIIFPGALGDLICLLPALHVLARRYPTIRFELMARTELAHFAVRRMPVAASHSIDRREVALLFSEQGGKSDLTQRFFGQF